LFFDGVSIEESGIEKVVLCVNKKYDIKIYFSWGKYRESGLVKHP
jgi:hypothetical protein